VPPGSRNFLSNPSGERGTTGWGVMRQQRRGGRPFQRWQVEDMETPVDGVTTTNFVSSFSWSVMAQTVQLGEVLIDPSRARIEVSAKFMGRTDCPSVFCLDSVLTDAAGAVLRRETTGQRDAPADGVRADPGGTRSDCDCLGEGHEILGGELREQVLPLLRARARDGRGARQTPRRASDWRRSARGWR